MTQVRRMKPSDVRASVSYRRRVKQRHGDSGLQESASSQFRASIVTQGLPQLHRRNAPATCIVVGNERRILSAQVVTDVGNVQYMLIVHLIRELIIEFSDARARLCDSGRHR